MIIDKLIYNPRVCLTKWRSKVKISTLILAIGIVLFSGCGGSGGGSDSNSDGSYLKSSASSKSISIINSNSTKITQSISSYVKNKSSNTKTNKDAILVPSVATTSSQMPVNNFEGKVNQ